MVKAFGDPALARQAGLSGICTNWQRLTVSKATWLGGGRALWRWNSWMVAALASLPSSSVLCRGRISAAGMQGLHVRLVIVV